MELLRTHRSANLFSLWSLPKQPSPPAPPPLCGGVTSHRTLRQSEDKGRKVPNMWHVACGMWEREGAIQRCGTRHKKRWSGSGLTAQRDPATQRPSALQYR